jgi:hypothetical protein
MAGFGAVVAAEVMSASAAVGLVGASATSYLILVLLVLPVLLALLLLPSRAVTAASCGAGAWGAGGRGAATGAALAGAAAISSGSARILLLPAGIAVFAAGVVAAPVAGVDEASSGLRTSRGGACLGASMITPPTRG